MDISNKSMRALLATMVIGIGNSGCSTSQRSEIDPSAKPVVARDMSDFFDRWYAMFEIYGGNLTTLHRNWDKRQGVMEDYDAVFEGTMRDGQQVNIGFDHMRPHLGDSYIGCDRMLIRKSGFFSMGPVIISAVNCNAFNPGWDFIPPSADVGPKDLDLATYTTSMNDQELKTTISRDEKKPGHVVVVNECELGGKPSQEIVANHSAFVHAFAPHYFQQTEFPEAKQPGFPSIVFSGGKCDLN